MAEKITTRLLIPLLWILLVLFAIGSPAFGATEPTPDFKLPFALNGFVEEAGGIRTQDDPEQKNDFSLGELRLQLEAFRAFDAVEIKYRGDFIHDQSLGQFEFDLREAHALFAPAEFMDLKVGRQILTWGTGDLIFLNDLFSKDFQSFFSGRDEEYLKAPSDSVKFSFFPAPANIDLVWTPKFNSDRFVSGERLSFFNSLLGRKAGTDNQVNSEKPDVWLEDSELAMRIFKNVSGYELALYGYYGFFKNPGGSDAAGRATFPRLAVYGASVRGNLLQGIGNMEVAYHDSLEDKSGTVPNVDNSQFRFLAGYTQEVAPNFTAGVQYNLERMIHHGAFIENLPAGAFPKDEDRHVTTLRLTRTLFQQNLTLSLFTFYSPSDGDAHLRPTAHYKIDDHWSAVLGGNIFVGDNERTFFAQLENDTNVYLRVRFAF